MSINDLTALDSSVIIAGLLSWHEFHQPTANVINTLIEGNLAVVPVPSLVEAYSVMTRLPFPHRLSPHDVGTILTESLKKSAQLVWLTSHDVWSLLETLARDNIAGGITYDAQIAVCAKKAKARFMLTLNPRDFRRLVKFIDGIEIICPID